MREREIQVEMKRGGRCPMVAMYSISWGVVEDLVLTFPGSAKGPWDKRPDHSSLVASLDDVAAEIEELEDEEMCSEMTSTECRIYRNRCNYMNGPSAAYPYA